MRHPAPCHGHRPGGSHCGLGQKARRQARWVGQPGARLAFSSAGDRDIHRQDEALEPGCAGASQHIGANFGISRRIHLKPRVLAKMGGKVFGALAGHCRQAVGDTVPGRRPRQMPFGIGPDQPGHSDRCDTKGQGDPVVEKRYGGIRVKFPMQDRGHQTDAVQRGTVQSLRRLRSGCAVKIFPYKFWNAPFGAVAQI